jgi:hypothetical protein
MLPLFHFIVFTSSVGNLPVARFVFAYFKIEPIQVQLWTKAFESRSKEQHQSSPGQYLVFDCSKMSFYQCPNVYDKNSYREILAGSYGSSGLAPPQVDFIKRFEQRFHVLLAGSCPPAQASALVTIIANSIPQKFVRESDLSFIFRRRGSSQPLSIKRVNLVDYVLSLLSTSSEPDPSQLALHRFISANCLIPKHLIVNPWLKK